MNGLLSILFIIRKISLYVLMMEKKLHPSYVLKRK